MMQRREISTYLDLARFGDRSRRFSPLLALVISIICPLLVVSNHSARLYGRIWPSTNYYGDARDFSTVRIGDWRSLAAPDDALQKRSRLPSGREYLEYGRCETRR